MDIDKIIFDAVNGQTLPWFVDQLFIYLHGISHVEIAFFLFCLILFLIVVGAPKRGPRAAIAVFIATMATYFGSGSLRALIPRQYPFQVYELAAMNLRADVSTTFSAFPVISNLMLGTLMMTVIFYFPKHMKGLFVVSLFYATMPIYLGIAYPLDAFGSLFVGFAMGYIQMTILTKIDYFARYN